MVLYDYIKLHYSDGEPILLEELEKEFGKNTRQLIAMLIKENKLNRYINGVYFLPYKTFWGTDGNVLVEDYISKKYLQRDTKAIGYYSGGQLANKYGLTTQNFHTIEIKSNIATTNQRTFSVKGRKIILKRPVTTITNDNKSYLELLDIIYDYGKYNEIYNDELLDKISHKFEQQLKNSNLLRRYIELYPDKIYKQLYKGGFYRLLK